MRARCYQRPSPLSQKLPQLRDGPVMISPFSKQIQHSLSPGNHKMAPRNHKMVPRNHRMVPLNHRMVPMSGRMAPLDDKMVPRNHRMAPLDHRMAPMYGRMAPLSGNLAPINDSRVSPICAQWPVISSPAPVDFQNVRSTQNQRRCSCP